MAIRFLKGPGSLRVPSPASALNDLNNAALSNAAAQNGGTPTVEDYQAAIDRLKGSSLPSNLASVAALRQKQAALQSKMYDDWFTKGNLDSAFKNSTAILGKKYAMNPKQLIDSLYALYDYHGTQLEQHINDLQADGTPVPGLASYASQIADQATGLEQLMDDLGGKGKPGNFSSPAARQDAQQFGFVAQTNGQGQITNFSLEPIPTGLSDASLPLTDAQGNKLGTAVRTNSTYGGIPLFVTPTSDASDPSGNTYTAKIGNLTFTGTKGGTGNQQPMTLAGNPVSGAVSLAKGAAEGTADLAERLVGAGKGFGHLGNPETGDQAKMAAQGAVRAPGSNTTVDLLGHITPSSFSDMTSLPIGSTWVDSTGKYYFMQDDGTMVSAPDAKTLAQNLNQPVNQVQQSAQFINSQDLQTAQSQQNPYLRSQNWLTDPAQTSPAQSAAPAGPTSMASPGGQTAMAPAQQAATTPASTLPTTTGKAPAIKSSQGPALAQNNTQQIAGGAQGLPNAMQTPA